MSKPGRPVTMKAAQTRLAILWLGGTAVAALLLIAMSFRGLEGYEAEVWGWFLPTVSPTLALILGTVGLSVRGGMPEALAPGRRIDRFPYRLAMSISGLYLALVLAAIVLWPLAGRDSPVESLTRANLWLGPLQGLAATAAGWFFVSPSADGEGQAEAAQADAAKGDGPADG